MHACAGMAAKETNLGNKGRLYSWVHIIWKGSGAKKATTHGNYGRKCLSFFGGAAFIFTTN